MEDRVRDIDVGLDLLREALEHAGPSPEDTCRAVVDARLSARPSDDIALLVARCRALGPDRVAAWDVPPDPAAVAEVRSSVTRRLADWGLEDLAFTTELILSELVTNAIRYGGTPIRVRVLRDRTLICEVFDSSSTAPHLRYAAMTDEGGRGLFLVAQLAERWGTRYLPSGKVIWAEQPLPSPGPGFDGVGPCRTATARPPGCPGGRAVRGECPQPPLSRARSSSLPSSAPLRLSAWALRNSSATSVSFWRSASWMYCSRRSALPRHASTYQMRL
ncbi:hypothetical protein SGLAM104S_08808 [Streptomyces glaucescens]